MQNCIALSTHIPHFKQTNIYTIYENTIIQDRNRKLEITQYAGHCTLELNEYVRLQIPPVI